MLFSELTVDTLTCQYHHFLALRMCAMGHPCTHSFFFLNIQMEGSTNNDLWQHWLYLVCDIGGWEDVFVSCLHPIVSSPPL